MIDYRDFMLQANKDIKRSKILYAKEDYGFSAYSAQQGLEKYLKAYLMKIGITKNPDNFKHLTYPKLFQEIINDLKEQRDYTTNDDLTNNFLDSFIAFFQGYLKLIKSFEESEPKKILCWKESLGIISNDEEKKILRGLEIELKKIKMIFLLGIKEFFNSIPSEKLTKPKLDPVGVSKLIALLQRTLQSFISNSNVNLEKELNEFQVIITPSLYGMKEDSLSQQDSDFFLKFFGLLKTFQWIENVILAYPHEEIGRYPFEIDGKKSLEIYNERKDDLLNMINSIELTCAQIKNAIIHG